MQLRYECDLTGEDDVSQQAWRKATIQHCPLHPRGGWRLRRHDTYVRLTAPGTRVARWYCRDGHCTFSVLHDCLAARLPGTRADVEEVIVALEQASSINRAVARLRPQVDLPGMLHGALRRAYHVYAALVVLRGLMPELIEGLAANIGAWRIHQGCILVLPSLRASGAIHFAGLPAPLGLRPHPRSGGGAEPRTQSCAHDRETGPMPGKDTDPKQRHDVALFRYGLIADLVRLEPGAQRLYERIAEKAAVEYTIPGTARTLVVAETLRHWLKRYRAGCFSMRWSPSLAPTVVARASSLVTSSRCSSPSRPSIAKRELRERQRARGDDDTDRERCGEYRMISFLTPRSISISEQMTSGDNYPGRGGTAETLAEVGTRRQLQHGPLNAFGGVAFPKG